MVEWSRFLIVLVCMVCTDSAFPMRSVAGVLTSLRLPNGRLFEMAGGARELINRYEPARGMFANHRKIIRAAYLEAHDRNLWMLEKHPEQFYAMQKALEAEEAAALARIDKEERFATCPIDAESE